MKYQYTNYLLCICIIITAALLSGCGKSEQSEADIYRDSMTQCYQSIDASTRALDSINPTSNTAVTDMLEQLDQINTAFQDMAALEVPEEYASVEKMADDAAYYMSESVRLYHEAFEGDEYLPDVGNDARAQYSVAMTYLSYIGQVLMGEIPEGDNVTVTYE